jgi:hypothetical protein
MNREYFFAQDHAGNRQKVHVMGLSVAADGSGSGSGAHAAYALDDGSAVERVDSDTFRIIATGALITLVRE